MVNLDQFLARNQRSWDDLDSLLKRSGRGARNLGPGEIDDLLRLYQLTSTHLSYASTNFTDPGLTARLSQLVSQAGALIYGTRPLSFRDFGRFFTRTIPAALYHSRRFILVSALFLFGPAVAMGVWLANSPTAINASAPPALRQAYVDHDFASYYRSNPSAEFAAHVWTNNVVVSLEVFALGALLCVGTLVVLAINGANVGIAAGLFAAAGQSPKFWGLILPHGLLELTSVAIAGAAGMRLGWALIDPGDRTRRDAIAEEGRQAIVLVLSTVFTLAVSGTIEGFVTGSALSTPVRVGIGVGVEVCFLAYALILGRRAHALGLTGAIGEGRVGWATTGDIVGSSSTATSTEVTKVRPT